MNTLIKAILAGSHHTNSLIFDYDSTISRIPIDWPTARLEFSSYLKGYFPLLTMSADARVDEMEALALQANPSEKSRVFEFRHTIESSVNDCHEPIDLTVEAIRFFGRKEQFRLFILSNNLRATVLHGLQDLNLVQYFEGVLGVDDVGVPKPAPKAFESFRNFYQLEPERCLFIGDNERTDGGFCETVGIPFINIHTI